MSNVPSVPTAPSQGSLPTPSTAKDGGAPPSPNLGSFEIGGDGGSFGYQLLAGSGIALTPTGKAVAVSAQNVPSGSIAPSGTNEQVLATENGGVVWATVVSPPTVSPAALSVDWSQGYVFSLALAAGANAITFANIKDGQSITLRLTSNAGGSTVTWPAGTKWAGGAAPTQTTPSGVDVYTFVNIGGTIYGSAVQAFA